ncbi:hypothetical protein AAFC00_007057 [Neodothiora populina]|uniref:DNA helicase n=1 Tax=Neodothiora populina TaxID=2781224 RepID=A0ABR3PC21_9PEZI
MDSDSIQESPVKRQRTQNGYRPTGRPQQPHVRQHSASQAHNTIATQPLSQVGGFSVAGLLSQINGSPSSYVTQPTQPLNRRQNDNANANATPMVEVGRSSPPLPAGSTLSPVSGATPRKQAQPAAAAAAAAAAATATVPSGLKRPGMGSRLAPAGTAFRRPPGVLPRPQPIAIPDDDDDDEDIPDPPIDRDSDDDTQPMHSTIRPTEFTRGGRNLHSSPNRVRESPKAGSVDNFKSITSQFAYSPAALNNPVGGGMESAYGGVSRNRPANVARTASTSASAAAEPDLTLDDILDLSVQTKIKQMKAVFPTKSIKELESALRTKKGNYNDACDLLFADDDDDGFGSVVDLTSSDIETNSNKLAAGPLKAPLKPAAKQEIKAPAKSILEKYGGVQAKPRIAGETAVADAEGPKKRRLVQGGRNTPVPRGGSPSPQKPSLAASKKKIVIDSDSEPEDAVTASDDEPENSDFYGRLLHFFNTCSARDLADLSNEKLDIAEFIICKRPFRDLDAVCNVSNAQPTKSGKSRARKPVGEKVYDVCRDMLEGYEAVDDLVAQCDAIGKPITDTMKQWGIDVAAATKDGELALTNLEDTLQDSGIGTPNSSVPDDDDDIVRPKNKALAKKNIFLKKPAIMSPDLVLKDYQLFGLNWLNLLWSKKLSCILADDMGLGKTCQVITFLAHLKETGVAGPHLIVVPGSTLENWIRELNRFCPALHVSPYYGSLAEREEWRLNYQSGDDEDIDVIVTTYETATGKYDAPFFRKVVRPVVAVFDEGHHLKNSTSKRHIELMRIPAEFRLLLTGTPLQNNLQELVSLLAFIMPKLITSEIKESLDLIFKYKATTKDADHAALLSAQRIKRARSMMTPFILRRKKAQVLKHMPAKIRRVEYCDMPASQKEIYDSYVAEAIRMRAQSAQQKPSSRGGASGSSRMAQEMTALRFAALHPLLLRNKYTEKDLPKIAKALKRTDEYSQNPLDRILSYLTDELKGGDFGLHRFCAERSTEGLGKFMLDHDECMRSSGKVTKLKELLEAYIANGDRVLIFSQFTTMMNILESVLENLGIKFMRLDGSTNMSTRQDIIDQFTTDLSIPVFMLSTKAGGAGINLACANKVVIFDSSFNPQDDIQAENRAHRVGQTREVEVVRLVTKGTIEEMIHVLGESKLALDERVAGDGNAKEELEAESKVEEMFFKSLEGEETKTEDVSDDVGKRETSDTKNKKVKDEEGKKDLKDEFRDGLKDAGLSVE